MSGVFGIVDSTGRAPVAAVVAGMAARMSHRPWYVSETYADGAVGLGRLGIGIFNREPQPARSEDGMLVVFLNGIVFDREGLGGLLPQGQDVRALSDPELILHLYREHGPAFAKHINGEFVALIWDRGRQELVLTNDRFGFYPTYYAQHQGQLLFAPEVKAITGPGGFPTRMDMTALAEYMRFQCLLGERTFVEGVTVLPFASVLRYRLRDGALSVEPYWRLADIAAAGAISFEEAAEEAGRLLARAVNRVPAQGYRTGLYLTGGLDSRLLLGLVDPRHVPMTTLTFGQRQSRDVVYARRLARKAQSRHHWFPLDDGTWVAENADLHVTLTEGFHGWIHAHGISTLPAARQLIDVALTGWGGGAVLGGWLNRLPATARSSDDPLLTTAHQFHLFNQRYTWPGLTEAEAHILFVEPRRADIEGRAFESLRQEVERYMDCRPELRTEYLYLRNHEFRMNLYAIVMRRSYTEACSPFFDADLFRFIYSLPPALRGYKLLLRAILQRRAPHLCYVPRDRDDFLPTTNPVIRGTHMWLTKLACKINAHVAPIFPDYPTLYADYEHYLRTDLRTWAHDLLLGPQTSERGLFNPVLLRALWDRMQSGAEPDIIGKLAPIMTYELMLRRLYDEA